MIAVGTGEDYDAEMHKTFSLVAAG
jgi:hypothetical protein